MGHSPSVRKRWLPRQGYDACIYITELQSEVYFVRRITEHDNRSPIVWDEPTVQSEVSFNVSNGARLNLAHGCLRPFFSGGL